jgi:hypothetical protein
MEWKPRIEIDVPSFRNRDKQPIKESNQADVTDENESEVRPFNRVLTFANDIEKC